MSLNPQARTFGNPRMDGYRHHRRHFSPHPPHHLLGHPHGHDISPPMPPRLRAYSFPGSSHAASNRDAFMESLQRDIEHLRLEKENVQRERFGIRGRGAGRHRGDYRQRMMPQGPRPFHAPRDHVPSHHSRPSQHHGHGHDSKGAGRPIRHCMAADLYRIDSVDKLMTPPSSEMESEEGETVMLSRSPSVDSTTGPLKTPMRPLHHHDVRHQHHWGHEVHFGHGPTFPPPPLAHHHQPRNRRGPNVSDDHQDHSPKMHHHHHHHRHSDPHRASTAPFVSSQMVAPPRMPMRPDRRPHFGRCTVHRGRSHHEHLLPFMHNVYV